MGVLVQVLVGGRDEPHAALSAAVHRSPALDHPPPHTTGSHDEVEGPLHPRSLPDPISGVHQFEILRAAEPAIRLDDHEILRPSQPSVRLGSWPPPRPFPERLARPDENSLLLVK